MRDAACFGIAGLIGLVVWNWPSFPSLEAGLGATPASLYAILTPVLVASVGAFLLKPGRPVTRWLVLSGAFTIAGIAALLLVGAPGGGSPILPALSGFAIVCLPVLVGAILLRIVESLVRDLGARSADD